MSKVQTQKIIYLFIFALLVFPRSFQTLIPPVHEFVNILKIFAAAIIIILFVKNKTRLSKFSIAVFIYFLFLFIITVLNHQSIVYFCKIYVLNFVMILFCEIIFQNDNRTLYLRNIAHLFFILVTLNLFGMIACKIIYQSYYFGDLMVCLLGQDNRIILYLLPPVIIYNYDGFYNCSKVSKTMLALTYLIGFISLFLVWSAAALVVFFFIILINILVIKYKKAKINLKLIFAIIILLNIGIVFFRIQNLFEFLIVDVLHKSLDLSYRTNIWDIAIQIFKGDYLKLVFGNGFFDITELFKIIIPKPNGFLFTFSPNHLHNIIMNNLFFSGIIGLCLYFNFILKVINSITQIKESRIVYNCLSVIFLGIQVLLIFDTFEYYQIYYFILFLLYAIPTYVSYVEKQNKYESDFKKFKKKKHTDSVAIMMATYNGEKYIEQQIQSIIRQTYHNWVLYISDDHSTDKTMQIIKKYQKKYQNKIVVVQNDNKFNSAKMNFSNLFNGVGKHNYYMFCDQDDVWDVDKIYKLLCFMKNKETQSKTPTLVYCDCFVTDSNLNILNASLIHSTHRTLPKHKLLQHTLVQNYFPGCVVMFNQQLKEVTGTIYEKCEMHDWWLTQVASYCGKIYFYDQALHCYRQHENNTIGAQQQSGKWKKRFLKIFKFSALRNNWRNFQKIIILQAEELQRRYSDQQKCDVVSRFISIMKRKNKLYRLFWLCINGYIPSEIIRIFRLI